VRASRSFIGSSPIAGFFVIICAIAIPLIAGTNRWTESKPETISDIVAIALDPFDEHVIYAVTKGPLSSKSSGLWRSGDAGVTWSRVDQNYELADALPLTVCVSPSNPDSLYVLGFLQVFRSSDGGMHWQTSVQSKTGTYNQAMALDATGRILYVGYGITCIGAQCINGGVVSSNDGGRSWQPAGLEKGNVTGLTADPVSSATLWATANGGVYKTTNAGKSWANISPPTPAQSDLIVRTIAIDAVARSTIYATSNSYPIPGTYVYSTTISKTVDSGKTWRILQNQNLTNTRVIATDPIRSMRVLSSNPDGRVILSSDGGETWTALAGLISPTQLLISPSGNDFYAVNRSLFHYTLVLPRRRAANQ